MADPTPEDGRARAPLQDGRAPPQDGRARAPLQDARAHAPERARAPRQVPRAWGAVALVCYLIHAFELVARFPVANLLWSCDVAAVLVSVGLLTSRPLPVAVGCFMFVPGNLVWLLDLAFGGELLPTAPLTHGIVFSLSILGARRLGLPRETWWSATLAMVVCTAAARVVGPESENVNLAFRIPPGWEAGWPSHAVYVATWTVLIAIGLAAMQWAWRRVEARAE